MQIVLICFNYRLNKHTIHKKCGMAAITKNLRINIFKEGKYLRASEFKAPSGNDLDKSLNDIQKVK